MDSEEAKHLRHARETGRPETDEGPYYHDAWWESYKGGIKGMLGGLIVGSGVGMAIGAAAAVALAVIAGVAMTPAGFTMLTLSFAAFGALKGAHEFSSVGVVTGAVAAAHETSETRMKEFESAKFAEIKHEIQDLKTALGADNIASLRDAATKNSAECDAVEARQADYRTTHCDDHCERPRKFMFLKVAAIGLAVGVVFGSLLGAAGMFAEFLHPVTAALGLHGGGQLLGASAIVGGAVGASFGINRDLFREVFDTTDHWFRGVPAPKEPQRSASQEKATGLTAGQQARLFIENTPETSASQTYFRDRVSGETARRALLSMDHTTAIRH